MGVLYAPKSKFDEPDPKAHDTPSFHTLVPLLSPPSSLCKEQAHSHLHAIFGEGRKNNALFLVLRTSRYNNQTYWVFSMCVEHQNSRETSEVRGLTRHFPSYMVLQRNVTKQHSSSVKLPSKRCGPRQYVEPKCGTRLPRSRQHMHTRARQEGGK